MLQPHAALPDVSRVPAPWTLHGHAWLVALRLPRDDPGRAAFVPPELRETLRAGCSVLMCVAYDDAPCGPYRELLFIPGTLRFGTSRQPSISRILVSTWDSVVNGRVNWGIPKDHAHFDWTRDNSVDRWCVTDRDREIAAFEFTAPTGPRVPFRSAWVPARWGTLAQCLDGRTYYCRPEATGTLRFCRLRRWHTDPAQFPDLAHAAVLAAVRIERFRMVFPIASVAA